ncbi:hypothetical protein [Streptomyces wuyuanensis]|uniref:hypothetical protein n=1 Tax=Streptomyces wuyuanensis TaxID=1196353 RepID=UPI003719807A
MRFRDLSEFRFRERLPDHAPHRPNHRAQIPDWVADSHALVHPDTPGHWAGRLAERHRILARSLADRGHTLANGGLRRSGGVWGRRAWVGSVRLARAEVWVRAPGRG